MYTIPPGPQAFDYEPRGQKLLVIIAIAKEREEKKILLPDFRRAVASHPAEEVGVEESMFFPISS